LNGAGVVEKGIAQEGKEGRARRDEEHGRTGLIRFTEQR
jgi:hypothetical protein